MADHQPAQQHCIRRCLVIICRAACRWAKQMTNDEDQDTPSLLTQSYAFYLHEFFTTSFSIRQALHEYKQQTNTQLLYSALKLTI